MHWFEIVQWILMVLLLLDLVDDFGEKMGVYLIIVNNYELWEAWNILVWFGLKVKHESVFNFSFTCLL